MTNQTIQMKVEDNGIAIITIDLPDSKVNVLSSKSMTELNDLLDKLQANAEQFGNVKGLVITSGKKDNFIAGADVKEIQSIQRQSSIRAYEAAQLGKEVFSKIEKLPYPSVAAINGICLGGGTELALACKYRVASENAKIGLPEVKLGFVPGWGGCVRLPKLVGYMHALDVIMATKTFDARRAWKAGLVCEVVPSANLLTRSIEIALRKNPKTYRKSLKEILSSLLLNENPLGRSIVRKQAYKAMMSLTKGKYPAPKEALNVISKSYELKRKKAFELESVTFAKLASTEISRNLVGIFFAQQDSKKLPASCDIPVNIVKVGVLGAGVMGAGIAQALTKAGYKVVLKDVAQEYVDKGRRTVEGLFQNLVEKRRLSPDKANALLANITYTTDYTNLRGSDVVVEAVLEDLEVKKQVVKELESAIGTNFIFASNTSSLSITDIAKSASNPTQVVGFHFFNPVYKMPLVEIIKAESTSDASQAAVMSIANKLDKTTVISKDSPGFIVNRILAPYLRESIILLQEGVPAASIDKAMKQFGMPMGPLTLLDEIGLDIAYKVIRVMRESFGDRFSEPTLMTGAEKLKLIGQKGGKGIYLYDENKKPAGVNPELQALITVPENPKSHGEIQDRLVLLMLNEAVRCLEENVVADPAQLDLAMIFGTGFPPFHGGILRWAESTGMAVVRKKLDLLSRVQGERYQPCRLLNSMADNKQTFYI